MGNDHIEIWEPISVDVSNPNKLEHGVIEKLLL